MNEGCLLMSFSVKLLEDWSTCCWKYRHVALSASLELGDRVAVSCCRKDPGKSQTERASLTDPQPAAVRRLLALVVVIRDDKITHSGHRVTWSAGWQA